MVPIQTAQTIRESVQKKYVALPVTRHPEWARSELLRKTIHMTVALVPSLTALVGVGPVLALLASGILVYSYSEYIRAQGQVLNVIGRITIMAARERDLDRPALGPITLALGAMTALMLYPQAAAAIAIYALAFGDGLAGLVGRLFGMIRIPHTDGKTIEGSTACLLAVFLSTYAVSLDARTAALIALTATLIELIPLKDLDNLALPAATGLVATMLLLA